MRLLTLLLSQLLLAAIVAGIVEGDYQHKEKFEKRSISVLLVNGLYTGHLFPLVSLGAELVKRGHKVALIANVLNGSHIYPDFPERVGIEFISAGHDNYWTKDSMDNYHEDMANGKYNFGMMTKLVQSSMLQIREKIESLGLAKFDIIICDAGLQPVAVFFHALGKKTVIFSPLLSIFQPSLDWPGPLTSSGQSDDLSFFERFCNAIFFEPLVSFMVKSWFTTVIQESYRYREVLSSHPDFFSYTGTRIPMIVASSSGFDYPKSRLPLVEYVGPVLFHTPPELNKDLKLWLDSKPPQTVIYILAWAL